ncbi:putative MscS family protein.1 precursor [Paraliobacillus sp. PM-2]|uniref:mechanosensitive ion channel family protein n=1 Tax=Paraliobacillus sp. PM-2 TaxID=1462524 RepID=UPI00061CCE5D|nr:mechanosensitive ion channel domain-containing protein [Paraliobacillus sp. PM-2]CQR45998.1 putative MscS family protein.1 precursor [Paraliobacillus sp. PM-2]
MKLFIITSMMNWFRSIALETSWYDYALVLSISFAVLLIFRFIVLKILFGRKKMNGEKMQAVRFFINWITFYSLILLLFIYFSDKNWMRYNLIEIGTIDITLFLIIIFFLIISFAHQLSKFITTFFMPHIYERYQLDRGMRFTFNRVFHYLIIIFAILISISTVGIDLSALTVFASVIGVGIGFGLQNIASNFISGIILLFERPIKVGDRVIVDDIIGDIEKINMRATIIKSIDNEHIIVPNSYFLEEQVVNRSYSDPTMRVIIPIGVSYATNPELIKELLLQIADDEAKQTDSVLLEPKPFVHFVGFGASSLDFELFIWISNPNDIIYVKTNINFRIYHAFQMYDIEIPFPQRDLHIRSTDWAKLTESQNKGN